MKGIMFKEALFQKVVCGGKTQTRRVVKIPESWEFIVTAHMAFDPNSDRLYAKLYGKGGLCSNECLRYYPGEVVYLKEPYTYVASGPDGENGHYLYKFRDGDTGFTYANKMFMPAEAARHFIRIESVGIECVYDISVDDIRAEGVEAEYAGFTDDVYREALYYEWRKLWDSINKPPYSYGDEPFVLVYRFKLVSFEEMFEIWKQPARPVRANWPEHLERRFEARDKRDKKVYGLPPVE